MKKKLWVITGPTATGKTKLAIDLAKQIDGEIVSADSRQLYRFLDIISGKDLTDHNFSLVKTLPESFQIGYYRIKNIPVWLYDVVDPKKYFSAYDWVLCAKKVIAILEKNHKQPIIAGGAYFYIRSLLYGLSASGVGPNWKLRQEAKTMTLEQLQSKLKQINPNIFNSLNHSDRNNSRRLTRWLEKASTAEKQTPLLGIAEQYDLQIIGLRYKDSETLKNKIAERVEQRLKQGALEEIELLLKMGYSREDPGLQSIGYQQLLAYFNDQLSLDQAKAAWLIKEKQYAKRQLTFMKKNPDINWKILP